MAAHVRLKNEFKEDEKYHNLITWLIYISEKYEDQLRHVLCFAGPDLDC